MNSKNLLPADYSSLMHAIDVSEIVELDTLFVLSGFHAPRNPRVPHVVRRYDSRVSIKAQ